MEKVTKVLRSNQDEEIVVEKSWCLKGGRPLGYSVAVTHSEDSEGVIPPVPSALYSAPSGGGVGL